MKKSKLLRKVAYPEVPQYADGFVPPAGYDHKIIVNLQNVDIKVYGFTGTQWEVIHNSDGVVDNFIGNVLHQKYYFESKTGVEQIVRASFLSSEEKAPLELDFGATHETRKFHHIEEVPAYYGSDEGKMLTIMSDGSLRWLGISESYVVEVIGTGGEETGTSHVSAHLEENGTLFGNAAIVDGILVSAAGGDYTRLAMTDDYRSSVNQTISFWFKSTYNPSNGSWMRFVHSHIIGQGPNGFFVEMRSPTKIYFKGATQGLLADNDPTAEAPYALNDGEWHQITVSWQDSGSEALRMWVDGQPLTVLNETHVGSGADTKPYLFIGARQFGSPMEMDKVGITEEFIDDAEALARYNSEAPAEAPVVTPEPLLWEDKFTLGGDASLYDDGDAGNVMRTNTTGFAWSFYNDFLTSEDPDQMIVSFWFKCNDEPQNTLRRDLFGSRSGAWGVMAKLIGNGNEIQLKSTYSSGAYVSPPPSKFYTIDLQRNVWYNVVITLDKVAGFARTYVNGVMVSQQSVSSSAQWSLGTNSKFGFGSTKSGSDNNASYEIFDFDSFQMTEGFALTDSQIASIYNDGSNREVVIASDM